MCMYDILNTPCRHTVCESERAPSAVAQHMRVARTWRVLCLVAAIVGAEPLFNEVIIGLLAEGAIPNGSIVDAGANTGVETCAFAEASPDRTVHALDPLQRNIAAVVKRCAGRLHNVRPLLGGLGFEERVHHVPARKSLWAGQQISIASNKPGESPLGEKRDSVGVTNILNVSSSAGQAFQVWPLDQLFATQWRDERLGFAHWDTEGNELDILRGGMGTLRRDKPIFSVECAVHKSPAYTEKLLNFIAGLGYITLLVEEEAGIPLDVRNLLNLPMRPRRAEVEAPLAKVIEQPHRAPQIRDRVHQSLSPTLHRHIVSGRLVRVNSSTIFRHAYPCCTAGGACCRSPQRCCMGANVPNRTAKFQMRP